MSMIFKMIRYGEDAVLFGHKSHGQGGNSRS